MYEEEHKGNSKKSRAHRVSSLSALQLIGNGRLKEVSCVPKIVQPNDLIELIVLVHSPTEVDDSDKGPFNFQPYNTRHIRFHVETFQGQIKLSAKLDFSKY